MSGLGHSAFLPVRFVSVLEVRPRAVWFDFGSGGVQRTIWLPRNCILPEYPMTTAATWPEKGDGPGVIWVADWLARKESLPVEERP